MAARPAPASRRAVGPGATRPSPPRPRRAGARPTAPSPTPGAGTGRSPAAASGARTTSAAASQRSGPRCLRNHQPPAATQASAARTAATTATLTRPPMATTTAQATARSSARRASHRADAGAAGASAAMVPPWSWGPGSPPRPTCGAGRGHASSRQGERGPVRRRRPAPARARRPDATASGTTTGPARRGARATSAVRDISRQGRSARNSVSGATRRSCGVDGGEGLPVAGHGADASRSRARRRGGGPWPR